MKNTTFKKLGVVTLAAAALLAAAGVSAQSQFAKAEDAIDYRQSAFAVLGSHFGRIGAMVNDKMPFDAATAQNDAAIALVASRLPSVGFGDGTEKGHNTKAKAGIWKEKDKFNAGFRKMDEEMVKLNAAAKTGNLDNLKAAFGPASQTCKACHDDFKAK